MHSIDSDAPAKKAGLKTGDQILGINGQKMSGKTREDAMKILQACTGKIELNVNFNSKKYSSALQEGDLFHVLAHFEYNPSKNDELSVKDGDIFTVTDSFPVDREGFWKAKKVKSLINSEEDKNGFIPNRQSAEKLLIKKGLLKSSDRRGGSFMRSFRRTKSMEKMNKSEEIQSQIETVAYENVLQKSDKVLQPVVIMGLFCNAVCEKLVRDSPGLFEMPSTEVEIRDNGSGPSDSPLVNVRLVKGIMNKGKHCLMIISPNAIEFLRKKTDLKPIVVYMSPVSKNIVKEVKARLAPNVNKKPAFMYEEAVKFEKAHGSLFSAIVPYKVDNSWFGLLKDTIDRIQKLPIWEIVKVDEVVSDEDRVSPDIVRMTKKSNADARNRHSKSTDDIPDEIQDLLNRHMGGMKNNALEQTIEEEESAGDILQYLNTDIDNLELTSATSGNKQRKVTMKPPKSDVQSFKSVGSSQARNAVSITS